MIRINLLPPPERTLLKWWPIRVHFCGLVMLLLLVVVYLYNSYVLAQLQEQISSIRNSYALLRPAEEKMLAMQVKQQTIRAKQDILVRLTNERVSWYAVVAQFGLITPSQVRLTDIRATRQDIIRVKGLAQSYPDLAAFLSQLEQDSLFTAPELVKAERIADAAVTDFELVVKIKGI